jgi:hypothetical protein
MELTLAGFMCTLYKFHHLRAVDRKFSCLSGTISLDCVCLLSVADS